MCSVLLVLLGSCVGVQLLWVQLLRTLAVGSCCSGCTPMWAAAVHRWCGPPRKCMPPVPLANPNCFACANMCGVCHTSATPLRLFVPCCAPCRPGLPADVCGASDPLAPQNLVGSAWLPRHRNMHGLALVLPPMLLGACLAAGVGPKRALSCRICMPCEACLSCTAGMPRQHLLHASKNCPITRSHYFRAGGATSQSWTPKRRCCGKH